MEELKFFEGTHTYKRGDIVVPSVSSVLRKAYRSEFDMSRVDPKVLRRASQYGTTVHNEIEHWLITGEQPSPSLEFLNFATWWEESGLEFVSSEGVIDGGWYAGKYDIIAKAPDGRRILFDLKTNSSVLTSKWSKQLSLYNNVLKCDEIFVVWLHNNKFRIVPIEDLGEEFVEETRRLYNSY